MDTKAPTDDILIGKESSFLRMEALKLVDPLDSDIYSSHKYRVFSNQFLAFGTSCLLASLFKSMRVLKPWKQPHRFYLTYGTVPALMIAIDGTLNGDVILKDLDSKYKEDFKSYLMDKAQKEMDRALQREKEMN